MDRTWERGYRINIVSCVEWCELVHEINVVSGWKVASAGNPCAHLFCSPHVIAPWPGVDYPVRAFNGRKFLLLSEVTWFGGRNLFLGSAYLVTGVIAVIMGIILLLIHLLCSRWWENPIHCMVHTCIYIALIQVLWHSPYVCTLSFYQGCGYHATQAKLFTCAVMYLYIRDKPYLGGLVW